MAALSTLWSYPLALFTCFRPQQDESSGDGPRSGCIVTLMSASQLDELPRVPSAPGSEPDYPRIVGEDAPLDCEHLEAFYRIQRAIRSTAEVPNLHYNTTNMWVEIYRISRTEIIKSPVGLNLLLDWLGLDRQLPNDEKKKQLAKSLRESYCSECSRLRPLVAQKNRSLGDILPWFVERTRDLETISFVPEAKPVNRMGMP